MLRWSKPFKLFSNVLQILALPVFMGACMAKTSLNFHDRTPAEYSFEPLTASRGYVESVLIQAFQIPETDLTSRDLLTDLIYMRGDFGGECDLYEAGESQDSQYRTEYPRERCLEQYGTSIDSRAISIPSRYAFTAYMCENLATNSNRFDSAMSQVFPEWKTTTVKPSPNFDGVAKVYQLFHRTEVPSNQVLSTLLNVGQTGTDSKEAWRNILIAVCISPSWQFL